MKKIFFLMALFVSLRALSQQDPFKIYRDRVFETLANLPVTSDGGDWRCYDTPDNFLPKWIIGVYNTPIIYLSWQEWKWGRSPGQYEDGIIYIDNTQLTRVDDIFHVIEHELFHAAFNGTYHVPGWMLYLMNKTDSTQSYDVAERLARALTVRRDIVDYYNIPLNSVLSLQQINDYITKKYPTGIDDGLNYILSKTRLKNLVHLLNFENGYEVITEM